MRYHSCDFISRKVFVSAIMDTQNRFWYLSLFNFETLVVLSQYKMSPQSASWTITPHLSNYLVKSRGDSIYLMFSFTNFESSISYKRASLFRFHTDLTAWTIDYTTYSCANNMHSFTQIAVPNDGLGNTSTLETFRGYTEFPTSTVQTPTLPVYDAASAEVMWTDYSLKAHNFVTITAGVNTADTSCRHEYTFDSSVMLNNFVHLVGDPALIIDSELIVAAVVNCHLTPGVLSITPATYSVDANLFGTIASPLVTILAPSSEANYRQSSFDYEVTLNIPEEVYFRIHYKESDYDTIVTPDHDISACRDAIYPWALGDATYDQLITGHYMDDLGNTLVFGAGKGQFMTS